MAVSPVPSDSRRNGLQVVARAADVLRALSTAPEGLSLSELAAASGLPKSTVHRLVGALEAEDFVTPAATGKVRLGRGLARLGAAARGSLRQEMRPYLLQLSSELEETVDLSVLDGACARFIDQASVPRRLAAVSAIGEAFPLHSTANGKALLAALPEAHAAALLPARLPRDTPSTITTRRELFAHLEQVRREGVAFDREEHTVGISAIGALVRDAYGSLAAVSVPMPTQRFTGQEERLAQRLLTVCAEASTALGAE